MIIVLLWLSLSSASRYSREVLIPYIGKHGPEHDHRHVWSIQGPFWGPLTYENFAASSKTREPVASERVFIDYNRLRNPVPGHIIHVEQPRQTFSVVEPGGAGGCGRDPYGTEHVKYARFPWPVQATVKETAQTAGCSVAMNAGYFGVHSGECLGGLVVDGQILQLSNNTPNSAFGIRRDGTLVTGYIPDKEILNTTNPFVHLVSGVVWLVRKRMNYVGESAKAEASGNEGTGTMKQFIDTISARTAIGHDDQGRVVLVHIEGQTDSRGMDLNDFANLLIGHGLVNAINLDGGGSATMVVNGTLVSYPSDHCHSHDAEAYRCEREVSTIVCVHPPTCRYPDCSGHGQCRFGICHCNDSWTGEGCQVLNCSAENCTNRGNCIDGSTRCNCTVPGYAGAHCDRVCPQGFYGRGCKWKCPCYHALGCSPFTGRCIRCEPGWMGELCNKTCLDGSFGQDCLRRCKCSQHGHCSPFTGKCICEQGWTGATCSTNATTVENTTDASPSSNSKHSDSNSVSQFLVILLGISVLVNALLTCGLSYSSQRTRT